MDALVGDVTPNRMIEVKYDRAKNICMSIWDNTNKTNFDDIYHDTILRCLITLGDKKYDQDYLKGYFFKAFRINMVRYYGYAYNRLKSGTEVENAIIPVEWNPDDHLDGFGMLDYVKKKYGEEMYHMLWDNYTGHTYKELDSMYHTNSFYQLSKIKNDLKRMYCKDIYLGYGRSHKDKLKMNSPIITEDSIIEDIDRKLIVPDKPKLIL